MEISKVLKLKKYLSRFGAYFILLFLGFMESIIDFIKTAFGGYGWRPFLARLFIVVLSLVLNPFNSAVQQFTTGAMKLFLLTCGILIYAICKLIYDYTKFGKEAEAKGEARRTE